VVSGAASYGVDDKTARRILSELLRKGEIYEKEHGHIRLVGG
jgi:DNA replicative helicase MCM subunit Mcm2 (Cdc46/Mcm family)